MRGFVLDTSVILKWFSQSGESDLDSALQLRQSMSEGTLFIVVPDLLFYELANALRHNPNLSKKDVEQAVCSVLEMGLEVRSVKPSITADYRFMGRVKGFREIIRLSDFS